MSREIKQLNIRLPDDIDRQLKAQTALDGLTMAQAVEELIRLYLDFKVKLGQPKGKPNDRGHGTAQA